MTQRRGCDPQPGLPQAQATAALLPHLSWGRAPGCRIGISPSLPRSTCPRWPGWGCCTASGPAVRPRRRCESTGRRAPIWPMSHPPVRKSLLSSCRGQGATPHPEPAEKPPLSHPTRTKSILCRQGKKTSKWSMYTRPIQHFNLLISRCQRFPGTNEATQKRSILGCEVRQAKCYNFLSFRSFICKNGALRCVVRQKIHTI